MNLFPNGIVLPFQKGDAPNKPIVRLTPTSPVKIPLTEWKTDSVPSQIPAWDDDTAIAAGQVLYTDEKEDLPVFSTVSGTYGGTVVIRHAQYGDLLCAEVHPNAGDEMLLPVVPEEELSPEAILRAARDAAIYDELDGVPLYEKLRAWQLPADDAAAIHSVLVADATENDIFGSAAWAVLATEAKDALLGLQYAAKALHFTRYHIATMLPKAKRRALKRQINRINIFTVPDEYPVTEYADKNAEVFRIGIQACVALAKAIHEGKKSCDVVLTVAGDGVEMSRNMRVLYGTDISDILSYCHAETGVTVILGDAMTGIPCDDLHAPLLPGTTTLLALRTQPIRTAGPCIGCGRCAAVCHAELLPYEIVRRLENMHYERLQHLSAQDCDGCGVCSYVCPAGRDVAAAVLQAGETDGTMFLNWGDDNDE